MELQSIQLILTLIGPRSGHVYRQLQITSLDVQYACQLSCEHQGEKDVRRHLDGKKHREALEK